MNIFLILFKLVEGVLIPETWQQDSSAFPQPVRRSLRFCPNRHSSVVAVPPSRLASLRTVSPFAGWNLDSAWSRVFFKYRHDLINYYSMQCFGWLNRRLYRTYLGVIAIVLLALLASLALARCSVWCTYTQAFTTASRWEGRAPTSPHAAGNISGGT